MRRNGEYAPSTVCQAKKLPGGLGRGIGPGDVLQSTSSGERRRQKVEDKNYHEGPTLERQLYFSGSASKHRRDISSYMYWAQSKWKPLFSWSIPGGLAYNLRAVEEGVPFQSWRYQRCLYLFCSFSIRLTDYGL